MQELFKRENATRTQGEQNPAAVCAPPGDAAGLKGSGRGAGAAPPALAPISTKGEGRGGLLTHRWLSDGNE